MSRNAYLGTVSPGKNSTHPTRLGCFLNELEGAGAGGAGGVAAGGYGGGNTGSGPPGLQGATCVNTNVEQNNPNC